MEIDKILPEHYTFYNTELTEDSGRSDDLRFRLATLDLVFVFIKRLSFRVFQRFH